MTDALTKAAQVAMTATAFLAGCTEMVQPKDIAAAEALCRDRGGYEYVARFERGGPLSINCKDGAFIDIRLPKEGK